jgi:hypothetical protein
MAAVAGGSTSQPSHVPLPLTSGVGEVSLLWMTAWFDLMAGVPQIAANLLQRTSRQPWANTRRRELDLEGVSGPSFSGMVLSGAGSTGSVPTTSFKLLFRTLTWPVEPSVRFCPYPELCLRSQGSSTLAAGQVKRQVTPEGA